MNLDRDNIRKIRGLILFTIFVLVILWNYKAVMGALKFAGRVILPFVLGGGIAFVLNVPMSFLEEKVFAGRICKVKENWRVFLARTVSFVLTLLCVLGLIGLICFLVIPELGKTLVHLTGALESTFDTVKEYALQIFKDNPVATKWVEGIEFNWDKILIKIGDYLKYGTQRGAELSFRGENSSAAMGDGAFYAVGDAPVYKMIKNLMSGVSTFFIAFIFACYLLFQKEKLGLHVRKFLQAFVPEDWRNIFLAFCGVTYKTFSNFLTGQCLESVILGSMFFVSMKILGLPYALLISVVLAIMALIPILGPFLGCGIGALLILTVSPGKALGFLVLFLVLQQIEDNLIYPHVVGNSVGLPAIWVLVAVTLGANLMGVVGMIIFIPITSICYTLLRGIVNRRLGLKE